jgi:hypothetical protein
MRLADISIVDERVAGFENGTTLSYDISGWSKGISVRFDFILLSLLCNRNCWKPDNENEIQQAGKTRKAEHHIPLGCLKAIGLAGGTDWGRTLRKPFVSVVDA